MHLESVSEGIYTWSFQDQIAIRSEKMHEVTRCKQPHSVLLHPSYLKNVFSLIIFLKERYSFTILSEKTRAPGGMLWVELKSQAGAHALAFLVAIVYML